MTGSGLLLLVVAAIFARAIGFDFVNYDDFAHVKENALICNFTLDSLMHFWRTPHEGLYMPVTYTVWGALAQLSAVFAEVQSLPYPHWFHGINTLVHLAVVLLLFQLLRRIFHDSLAALAGALLFAVHPVQVETVAWVSSLKELLAGLGAILSVWLYLLSTEISAEKSRQRLAVLTMACGSFLFGILAAPVAVVTPLMAGTLGWLILRQSRRQLLEILLPWLLLAIPVIILTKMAQPDTAQNFLPSFPQRLLIAGDTLSFYAGKVLWPGALAPDYGRTPQLVLNQPWLYLTALLPFLVGTLLAWRLRHPLLWLAIAFFVLPLLPVLGLVTFNYQNISTVADRYLYLAMAGPALLTAWLLSRHRQRPVMVMVLLCLLGLGVRSTLLLSHWRDSYTINNHILKVNPLSGKALNNLGIAYQEDNLHREAIATYLKAVQVAPNNPEAYMNLGILYRRFGSLNEAIYHFQKAILLVPGETLIHCNLGEIFLAQGNAQAAMTQFRLAAAINPSLARAQVGMASAGRLTNRP